jgi:homoserine O-acetyltransferase/O-succinyltransferase
MKIYEHKGILDLETGGKLYDLKIAYHTYGTLNKQRNNVIWICHALTASSDAAAWWPGMIGEGKVFDTNKYFIVCANIIGSCYGSTGPLSINPLTQKSYYHEFPFLTIRDLVNGHRLLCKHLNITGIELLVGGSMGGYQALEWCLIDPELIQKQFLIATSAREAAWRIAIHSAQRLAIEADTTWILKDKTAGANGLKTARAIGMLTYRSYQMFRDKQTDDDLNKVDGFKAASYIEYQGNKLVNRFNAFSYWQLTKTMDSHNIARNRSNSLEPVLSTIHQPTITIGITSDYLCPVEEQQLLASCIPNADLYLIDSAYGHDGFLTEVEKISSHLAKWLSEKETIKQTI